MNKPAEEAVRSIGCIFDKAIARERARFAPPWEGDDEDAVRYRTDERRKQDDDREWVRSRHRYTGENIGD